MSESTFFGMLKAIKLVRMAEGIPRDELEGYEFVKKRTPELEMEIVDFRNPPRLTGMKSYTMHEGQIYDCYLRDE